MPSTIGTVLQSLAPPGVRVGVRPVDDADIGRLHPDEAALIASASGSRRRAFASGRALLHELLADPSPIGRLANGAPSVADGWSVSLAHDRDLAIAAVAIGPTRLGVDIEGRVPLSAAEAGIILRSDDAVTDPLVAFAMKEATYKAWSRSDRPIIEHHDVRIELAADGAFRAVVGTDGTVVDGRYAEIGDRVVVLVSS